MSWRTTLAVACCLLPVSIAHAQQPCAAGPASKRIELIPQPQEITAGQPLSLARGIAVDRETLAGEDHATADDLADTLRARGVIVSMSGAGARLVLLRLGSPAATALLKRHPLAWTPAMHDEGYELIAEGSTVYDLAATSAGEFYGAQTIVQLVNGHGKSACLETAIVRDWPAMKYRGISDDLSRGPVPTLAFQERVIRTLASYKMNVYSPYMETAFAYTNEPLAAPPGGAITPSEYRELVAFAAKYYVTIVPEQEAFGHLHHALMYEKYDSLGETPLGSALAPGQPGSAQLIGSWFQELAWLTPGPFLHIGADEVNELGLGQSKSLIDSKGAAKTYLDFVTQIHAELQPLHKRLLFWGDIAMKQPELVKTLPKDMIAVAWEYGPKAEGFDKWIRPYKDAGMETWVSPGINNWGRIYPSSYEGVPNIQQFVRDGQRLGATGMLNTVWNAEEDDEGLFSNDWYGVIFGAAASWQAGESSISRFADNFGEVFYGDATGKIDQAQEEITLAEEEFRSAGYPHGAMTPLFWADPWTEQGQVASAKLLPHVREIRLHAERAIELLKAAREAAPLRQTEALDAMELGARRIDFLGFKFEAADQIAQAYRLALQHNDGKRSVGSPLFHVEYLYEDLIYTFGELHDLYEAQWKLQNRPYTLHNVLVRYDMSEQTWMRRRDEFDDAKAHFLAEHHLPPPSVLEMPAATSH